VIIRRPRLGQLRPRTLRAKLTWGTVVLLALSSAAIGLGATFALRGYLVRQLDSQLTSVGCHFSASLGQSGARLPGAGDQAAYGTEQGGADTRGVAIGTFGALVRDGSVSEAVVVRTGGSVPVALDAADSETVADIPMDGGAHSITLSQLGDYRAMACSTGGGTEFVAALPLAPVQQTVSLLAVVAVIVSLAVLAVTGIAAALWVRAALRPLSRVAAAASAVTALTLERGEVRLPAPVAGPDDPRSEAGQVAVALDRMLGHVQAALARRQLSEDRLRSFAADASHELRTPVAAIRGHAELALRHPGPVPEPIRRALERTAAESARLGAMVDELLLLAQLDAGRPLARESVDLTRLVLDAVEDARASGPGHRWELDLSETPVTVPGDGARLAQATANLLMNARRHTPPGTRITVGLELRPDRRCALTVSDDGPGIPAEFQPSIFERFTRAERRGLEAGHGGGAGLGLAITSAIVEAHGGTLKVRSQPGSTVFTITLPGGDRRDGPP
jgi:two-component system OmpR family sensor kinase